MSTRLISLIEIAFVMLITEFGCSNSVDLFTIALLDNAIVRLNTTTDSIFICFSQSGDHKPTLYLYVSQSEDHKPTLYLYASQNEYLKPTNLNIILN